MLFIEHDQRFRFICLLGCSLLFPTLVLTIMICGEPCRLDNDPQFAYVELACIGAMALVYSLTILAFTRELFMP